MCRPPAPTDWRQVAEASRRHTKSACGAESDEECLLERMKEEVQVGGVGTWRRAAGGRHRRGTFFFWGGEAQEEEAPSVGCGAVWGELHTGRVQGRAWGHVEDLCGLDSFTPAIPLGSSAANLQVCPSALINRRTSWASSPSPQRRGSWCEQAALRVQCTCTVPARRPACPAAVPTHSPTCICTHRWRGERRREQPAALPALFASLRFSPCTFLSCKGFFSWRRESATQARRQKRNESGHGAQKRTRAAAGRDTKADAGNVGRAEAGRAHAAKAQGTWV